MAKLLKTIVQISVNPRGEIHTEVAGEPVDATDLLEKWAAQAEDYAAAAKASDAKQQLLGIAKEYRRLADRRGAPPEEEESE